MFPLCGAFFIQLSSIGQTPGYLGDRSLAFPTALSLREGGGRRSAPVFPLQTERPFPDSPRCPDFSRIPRFELFA